MPARPTRTDLRDVISLAVPVVVVQLGLMLMGTVDTLMVGRVSEVALAATALANIYFYTIAMFAMGTLMVIDPIVAQAVGADDGPAIRVGVQRGLLMAALLTVLGSLGLLGARPVLTLLRQPAAVVDLAGDCIAIAIPGLLPFLAFAVVRQALQAMQRMREIVLATVAANLLNVALNWVLIHGHLGSPARGAVGSAWSTAISRWALALALLALAWPRIRGYLAGPWREARRHAPLGRMLRLGLPIGLQYLLELSAFNAIALFMGWIGTSALAGHEIALNIAALTFMVPLGVSAAGAVLVGQAVGARDEPRARRAAAASLLCGVGFMCATAAALLLWPSELAGLFTTAPGAAAVAASLIPLAGIFQVFDGTQVVSAGILRGIGDTRAPVVVNLLGFWLVGVPISLWLGFRTSLGAVGLWWGLVAGLVVVATFLLLRVRIRLRRALERLDLESGREETALDQGLGTRD